MSTLPCIPVYHRQGDHPRSDSRARPAEQSCFDVIVLLGVIG
jgi:hypothetical protein